jgi:hypothetical protein
VAMATTWTVMSSIVISDVLCREMTMYCSEDYGLSSIMSKHVLSFYVLLLYSGIYPVTNLFWRLPIRGGRHNRIYIKNCDVFVS